MIKMYVIFDRDESDFRFELNKPDPREVEPGDVICVDAASITDIDGKRLDTVLAVLAKDKARKTRKPSFADEVRTHKHQQFLRTGHR